MINKKFKIISITNSIQMLKIEFEDKKYDFLTTLFFADGSTICESAMEKIDEINNDKISIWEATGNVCSIKITKEMTTVYDIFDESIICNISTSEFASLIEDWRNELSKLDK